MCYYTEKKQVQNKRTYRPPDTITYDCNIADKV